MRGGIYAPKVSIPLEGKVPLRDKGGRAPPRSWDKGFSPAGGTLFASGLSGLRCQLNPVSQGRARGLFFAHDFRPRPSAAQTPLHPVAWLERRPGARAPGAGSETPDRILRLSAGCAAPVRGNSLIRARIGRESAARLGDAALRQFLAAP